MARPAVGPWSSGGRAPSIRKVAALSHLLGGAADFDIIAVDVPIGLLDAYEVGGRACDRAARKLLGVPRASSVFTRWP
jgi:predicted RNase H-like nuclease